MSILSPHEIVTPGAGDKLDRLRAGVGPGVKGELGAWDIVGTDVLLGANGPDNENVAFKILNSCKNVQSYRYFLESLVTCICQK